MFESPHEHSLVDRDIAIYVMDEVPNLNSSLIHLKDNFVH